MASRTGRERSRAGLAAAAVIATVAACRSRPAAGVACRTLDQLVCVNPGAALICEGTQSATQPAIVGDAGSAAATGSWVSVPCKGARGCSKIGAADDCDDSLATVGDGCPRTPGSDYACAGDHVQALVCKDGVFTLWRACRGPDGCVVEGSRNVRCDTTLGEPGDPCGQTGTYACAADHQTMLGCDGAHLGAVSSCRGPKGCQVERDARKVECDDAVAMLGDPCDQEGRIACAQDHKAELACAHGKYDKKRDCLHSDCRLEGSELFCD